MLRFLLSLSICAVPSIAVAAEAGSSLYYILDGSGSMWGRVDGKPKITVAKDVMSTLIKEMPSEVEAGLTVYGHRKKGDCSDIEEVIPLGKLNKNAAIKKVRNILPKGKTPISDSIKQAVGKLKSTEQTSTVVLVSDGIETCGQDPCALTKELKDSGVHFVMHVVGFGIRDNDVKQLSCIAKAGGGKFYQSKSASQLLAALNEVKTSVVEKKPIVVKPEPTPEPVIEEAPEPTRVNQQLSSTSKSIRIKAKGPGRVTFEHPSWLKKPYYWKLIDPESGEDKGKFQDLTTASVAPGDYQLVWHQHQHSSRSVMLGEVFSVESGKTTVVPLSTSISLVLPDWVEKPYRWQLVDPVTSEMVAQFQYLDEPVLVPSGTYELHWHQHQHRTRKISLGTFNIEPDKENRLEIITALNPLRADWVPEELYFWAIQRLDQKPGDHLAHFKDFKPQLVPPGKYRLIYRMHQHTTVNSPLGEFEVKPGELNEVAINTGVKLIPTDSSMPAPYKIEYVPLDSSGKEGTPVYIRNSFNPMPLGPGTYRIKLRQKQHSGQTVTIVDSFELPAGNLVEIEL